MNETENKEALRPAIRRQADALVCEGEFPSANRVMKALGRGSKETVIDEIKQWRKSLGQRLALLDALPEGLREGFLNVWSEAKECASAEFDVQTQAFAVEKEQLEFVASGLEDQVTGQQQKLDEMSALLDQAQKDLTAATCAISERDQQVDAIQKALGAKEQLCAQRDQALQHASETIDRLHAQIEQERQMAADRLEEAHASIREWKQQADTAREDYKAASASVETQRERIECLNGEIAKQTALNDQLSREQSQAQSRYEAEVDKLNKRIETLDANLGAARRQYDTALQESAEKLLTKITDKDAIIDALQRDLRRLEKDNAGHVANLERSRELIKQLTNTSKEKKSKRS